MTGHGGLVQAVHSVIQTVHTRYADGTYPSCGRYISAMQMGSVRQSSLP